MRNFLWTAYLDDVLGDWGNGGGVVPVDGRLGGVLGMPIRDRGLDRILRKNRTMNFNWR